jgi:hypothetical protein
MTCFSGHLHLAGLCTVMVFNVWRMVKGFPDALLDAQTP